MIKKILLALIAGVLGGLTNSIGIWLTGKIGLNQMLGFQFQPELTIPWMMPRLVSSGLWGLLYLLPFWREKLFQKGFVLSFGPLVMMLFMVFPKMGAGIFGLELGYSAPVFAFAFTQLWGFTAALFLRSSS
jgi:hypothetical protein